VKRSVLSALVLLAPGLSTGSNWVEESWGGNESKTEHGYGEAGYLRFYKARAWMADIAVTGGLDRREFYVSDLREMTLELY
jgi:hypothetical protein